MNKKQTDTDRKIDIVGDKVDKLTDNVGQLNGRVDQLTTNVQDVLEAVSGLSSHMDAEFADVRSQMVTKDEFKSELDRRFGETENRIINEIDHFVVLHQTLDVELASLRSRTNRHDTFLHKVAKKLDLEFEPV